MRQVVSSPGFIWIRLMLYADMNKVYGFEGEAKNKLGEMTYKLFADVFTARMFCSSVLSACRRADFV